MSKKGPENVTQTTSTEPPDYLLPFLRQATGSAQALFQRGPQQYFSGNTVTPFSPQTNMALNLQQGRALGGSPVTSAAQGLTTKTLNGDFLNANPYLDATFDRAAGAVGRQLDTTMARAGRDLDANMGVRADALNNLATDIYGRNYQSERDRQVGAVGSAIPLAREDYFDIAQLGGVGQAVEGQAGNIISDRMNRFNFAQEAPYASLDRFISQLSGSPMGQNSSSTSPVFTNTAGNLLGGALAGASLFGTGGALAGTLGLGGAGGAGLGALAGLLSDRRKKENIRRVGQTDSGLPIYVYNYIGDPTKHMGVMADEVEHISGAVTTWFDGFNRVDYGVIH